jgi:DNA-directed RNA polymerase specialized sigma24 family protein
MTTIETQTSEELADDIVMLERVRHLTKEMRSHEASVVAIGKRRREVLKNLRGNNVPYRRIAEAMGTSEQAVYKDLRWGGQPRVKKQA